MRKSAELEGPSCITKAWDDEMIFVLLARDEAAPVAIEAWISERIRTGKIIPKMPRLQRRKNVQTLCVGNANHCAKLFK